MTVLYPNLCYYEMCYKGIALYLFQIILQAYGSRKGQLDGLLVSTPYPTKDLLQLKRYQAQSNGTTYVYDFPEMFKQVSPVYFIMIPGPV